MAVADPTLPLDPLALRADFPILQQVIHGDKPLIYLDNAATTQHPREVIDALIDVYENRYANVHRGIHWLSDQSTDLYEVARDRVRRFLGAERTTEIIFTSGTTGGINLVARSWGDANVQPGDEILLTEMEHHSNIVPWHQLAERTGCSVKFLPVTDDGLLELDRLGEFLSERTRLVSVAGVSNVLGTINPVREIADRAHAVGALMMVDAAQSVPHMATDVQALGADFLVCSGHKMLGPSGVGVLYGRETLLEAMPPFLGGGSMIRYVRLDGFDPADLPAKFEAGTPPITDAICLTAAIDYLERIGFDNISAYERILARRAHEVLGEIEGLSFLGPSPEKKAGIVSFVLDKPHPHDVAQLLDRNGIAIRAGHHCTMPLHERLGLEASNRASFYFYNTLSEVDELGEALRGIKKFFSGNRKRRRRSS